MTHLRNITLAGLFLWALSAVAVAATTYRLEDLLHLAQDGNRVLAAGGEAVAAARAGIDTAAALPNPELEFLTGSQRPRTGAGGDGTARSAWFSQRIEYPSQRQARVGAATAGVEAAVADWTGLRADVVAGIRLRFHDLLRRQAEQAAAQEDLALMEDIRSRVELKVHTGEAARYELIKADAEMLNARKAAQSAKLRVAQAQAVLRQAVGAPLASQFEIEGRLDRPVALPTLETLRTDLVMRNPELQRLRALRSQAERQLDYERTLRLPAVSLKGGREEDRDMRAHHVGVVVTVPLFDRRRGPVDAAGAQLARARHDLEGREFALLQALEAAYRQYEVAATQVATLETAIVQQAAAALRVAEAAYRYGERGILDYLDAQRVFRAARGDLIAARHELQLAAIEIDRLRAAGEPSNP